MYADTLQHVDEIVRYSSISADEPPRHHLPDLSIAMAV
jgi:hypothetical protein